MHAQSVIEQLESHRDLIASGRDPVVQPGRTERLNEAARPRFLAGIDAQCIDSRRNEVEGTSESLFAFRLPNRIEAWESMISQWPSTFDVLDVGFPHTLPKNRDLQKRLLVTCPTGRLFALGVPAEIQTCEQAQRWLWPVKCNVIART